MSPNIPITESMIRGRTHDKSYGRGEALYRDDALFDTVRRGDQIEGFCTAASQVEPYHVRAILDKNGIAQTFCTCLYEFGGDCKHIVALLLTYLREPEKFEQRAPVEDVLASRDKAQLITLIRQMVARYPDLQAFIDRPVPGQPTDKAPLDTAAFKKELRRALQPKDDWGDRTGILTVHSIMQTANTFAQQEDWRGASAIYCTIIDTVVSQKECFYDDEEGELSEAVDQVVQELDQALLVLADDDEDRSLIFESLLNLYLADIDVGDVGADAPDVILRYVRSSDIPAIRKTVQTAQKRAASKPYGDWEVRAYTEFLANLDLMDNVDPEVILIRLRGEEQYSLLVGKLIEFGRVDEAVTVVQKYLTRPHERLPELMRLTVAGRADDAIRLAEDTLKTQHDPMLMEWLLAQLREQGDKERHFQWQLRRMYAAPDDRHYASLKASAVAGQWEQTSDEVIRWLKKEKRYPILVRVYLQEERWNDAWETLEQFKSTGMSMQDYASAGLEMEVAERTRTALPRRALPVYIKHVRRAIDQRNRDDYRRAAEYLSIIQDLYGELDETESWDQLIRLIREEYKRLPALQDELRRAGL